MSGNKNSHEPIFPGGNRLTTEKIVVNDYFWRALLVAAGEGVGVAVGGGVGVAGV